MTEKNSRNIPERLEDIETIVRDLARVLKKGYRDTLKEVLGEKPFLEICSECGSLVPIDNDQYPLNFEPGNIVYSAATQRYGLVLEVKPKIDPPIIGIITVLTVVSDGPDLTIANWGILKNEKSITIQVPNKHPFWLSNLLIRLKDRS